MKITKEMNNKKTTKNGLNPTAQKGITLIALVITIIIMLILVGVTISMAVNGGLFDYAGKAVGDMNNAMLAEQQLANGGITIGDKYYNSIDEYLGITGGNGKGEEEGPIKITLSISGTDVTTVPVPTGFTHTEGTINEGYVIQDADGNEFVWVPVKQGQKITLKVESESDIQNIVLKDPMGAEIELGLTEGNIGKTYNNTQIQPTYNGMYAVRVETEEETVKETLVVRSLYAIDTWNDFYISDEGVNYLSQEVVGQVLTKELLCTVVATQMLQKESLEKAMEETGCADIDEFITYVIAAMHYGQMQDQINYKEHVEDNGGFFVGRFELGTTKTPTTYETLDLTLSQLIDTHGVPATKAGCYPYHYITFNQALGLTESMYNSSEFTDGLITSAAWDRTLGWIYETSANKEEALIQIAGNSLDWGNYMDAGFTITTGSYRVFPDWKKVSDEATGTYEKLANSSILLTTGATTIPAKRNCKNNIFDLAGNLREWCCTSHATNGLLLRGGANDSSGMVQPAANVGYYDPDNDGYYSFGARTALFLAVTND